MTNLDKAKEIIKKNYKFARAGIFNTPNLVGDEIDILYNDNSINISICKYYEYFEVFGLSDNEFAELKDYYEQLVREKKGKKSHTSSSWLGDVKVIKDIAMDHLVMQGKLKD